MEKNPEKGKIESRGEMKPNDKRQASDKTVRALGKAALGKK